MKHIAVDAFGTLLHFDGHRINPYARLINTPAGEKAMRLPFLTRDVPPATFAEELGLVHLIPLIERELTAEIAAIRLFDDVADTLRRLRGAGHRIVVCSNLAQPYGEVIRRLLPDLDGHVCSYEVGAKKPDPAIYQAVCDALNCRPQDVLFIGDSKRADFDGPRHFGMQARLIDRKAGQKLAEVLA